jgi:hypothetical protein
MAHSLKRFSGEKIRIFPRRFSIAPWRSHFFVSRLAVKVLTFARPPRS